MTAPVPVQLHAIHTAIPPITCSSSLVAAGASAWSSQQQKNVSVNSSSGISSMEGGRGELLGTSLNGLIAAFRHRINDLQKLMLLRQV
jgi:hypothetical protein